MPAFKRALENGGEHGGDHAARKRKKSSAADFALQQLKPHAEEEFKRGGGSTLTPLEKRQLEARARRDVLFEQQSVKIRQVDDVHSSDEDPSSAAVLAQAKKPRTLSESAKRSSAKGSTAERFDKARGLSFKRLAPGSTVLGHIAEITHKDLALSLPNNLTGYVQLSSISKGFSARADEAEDLSEYEILTSTFQVGQLLRACVLSTSDTDLATTQKRRIELSIEPSQVNKALNPSDLILHSMIQTEVTAIEDHGLVVTFGLDQPGTTGFISKRELGARDPESFEIGSVLLCVVVERTKNSKVVKLSIDPTKLCNVSKSGTVKDAPSIDILAPGVAVEVTVSEATPTGLVGSVLGLVKVMSDVVHCGMWQTQEAREDHFRAGSKHTGRIIWKVTEDGEAVLGVSFLNHLLGDRETPRPSTWAKDIELSTIVNDASVIEVEPNLGLFLDLGPDMAYAFVHISRVADEKIQQLARTSGPYAIGTKHRCRILGFNATDNLSMASMEQKVLELPFLRLEDLNVGQLVKGSVESFVRDKDDVVGLLVKLTDSISGLATKLHLSDVVLEQPEKKFKPGSPVTCRVLSMDLPSRRLRLTLKRSLVNSDAPIWKSIDDPTTGVQVPGTLISFVKGGAIIQFYGDLRGFLPLSQMSEAYLTDAKEAFRLGQVISVQVLSRDTSTKRLILTCLDIGGLTPDQERAFTKLQIGAVIEGKVIEKSKEDIIMRLNDDGFRIRLAYEHLDDGSKQKISSASKRIRIEQTLKDLVVLQKDFAKASLRVTSKPSLKKAFSLDRVPHSFEQLMVGMPVTGYINNTTSTGVFVSFSGGLTALLPKSRLYKNSENPGDVDLSRNATIDCKVASVDGENQRFMLSREDQSRPIDQPSNDPGSESLSAKAGSTNRQTYSIGQVVDATIVSKKATQLNVELADGAQGRIDVSEAFNKWEEVKDRKHPLRQFHLRQKVPVRVLGVHDSKTHRFLPISHVGKAPVFELSLRSAADSADTMHLSIDKIQVGSQWLCFVNNVEEDCLWVNLSPNVRGRIDALDLSDNATLISDLPSNFPVGSAIRARVTHVDSSSNKLDLNARVALDHSPVTIQDLAIGSVHPAKITKIQNRNIVVQLNEDLSAPINLVDLADDFSTVDLAAFHKNQMIAVSILAVDISKNKLRLSARTSRTREDAATVEDKEINSIADLDVDDIVRGFVKNTSSNGLFVSLGSGIDAFVHLRDLSDSYIKEWESLYNPNEVVKGKIVALEPELHRVQMSLKKSILDPNYKPPLSFNDVKVGDVLTGRVRKVEDFGAFIVFDNSANVSGLCHRSQLANEHVSNAKDVLEEGDPVRVAVLKVDATSKRISLSLKSSHIGKHLKDEIVLPHVTEHQDPEDNIPSGVDMVNGGIDITSDLDTSILNMPAQASISAPGLTTGYDWTGSAFKDNIDTGLESDTAASVQISQRTKRKKLEAKVDRTANLDAQGPQSVADFERLLLGQPNSSYLWLSYMAHHLQHAEIDAARAVAERAVKTINHQSQDSAADAMNAWIAYLNLENAHGDEEAVDSVFKRACEVNDPQELHSRLASIYIQSDKLKKADDFLSKMVKAFSQDPKVWLNYATFLFDSVGSPTRGRDLLERALTTLAKSHHVEVTSKFAQLEFRSKNGEPERGRTLFEGLVAAFPKRLDLWDVLLDQEMKLQEHDQVRRIFARVTSEDLKPKKAKHFFKRWLDFEKASGSPKEQAKVEAKAAEYVRLRENAAVA